MSNPEAPTPIDALKASAETLKTRIEAGEDKSTLIRTCGQELQALAMRAKTLYVTANLVTRELIQEAIKPLLTILQALHIIEPTDFEKGLDSVCDAFPPLSQDDFTTFIGSLSKDEFCAFTESMEFPNLSPKQERRLSQLALMKTLLSALSIEFAKGGDTWTLWAARLFVSDGTAAKTSDSFQTAATEGILKCADVVIKNPELTLDEAAPGLIQFFKNPPSLVGAVLSRIQFSETTATGLNTQRAACIAALRGLKAYSDAESIAQEVLNGRIIAEAGKKIPEEERRRIQTECRLLVFSGPRYENLRAAARAQGIPEKNLNSYLDAIALDLADKKILAAAAQKFDASKLSPSEQAVWAQYNDMEGFQGALNWSDQNVELLVNELLINGTLILASAATGAGAAAVAGRLAAKMSAETISFIRTSARLSRALGGAESVAEAGALFTRGLTTGVSLGTDALVSELTSVGLFSVKDETSLREDLENTPEWLPRVLWGVLAGGLGETASRFASSYPPEALSLLIKTIADPRIRRIGERLAIKGQAEAVGRLLVACVQEGVCNDPEKVQTASDLLYTSYLQTYGGSMAKALAHA